MAVEIKKPSPEKLKALQLAMDKIEKDHGRGTIMKMGDNHVEEVNIISTGSIGLNMALGVGGFPRGRVIEIYGPESSGKTTLAIHAIAEAQKAGGIAAIIDAEHAFDRFYAEKLGVDIENLLISQPDSGEQALEVADQLIRSSAVDIVVIDSVAALTPKAELEGDMGDSKMGLQARLMSQALRKLTAKNCITLLRYLQKCGFHVTRKNFWSNRPNGCTKKGVIELPNVARPRVAIEKFSCINGKFLLLRLWLAASIGVDLSQEGVE